MSRDETTIHCCFWGLPIKKKRKVNMDDDKRKNMRERWKRSRERNREDDKRESLRSIWDNRKKEGIC